MSSTGVALPNAMFPQIFRKDLRLLWPLAVAGAAGQALLSIVLFHLKPFHVSDPTSAVASLVTLGLIIAMVLLIVLTVQQDPIPGVTQDWLVRPIRRRDLLLAKLLMVAVFIHGPIMVVKLLEGLAEGLPFGPLLTAVLLSNFECALVFSLPVMVVASLTRSVGEALLGAIAVFFGLITARFLILGLFYPVTHSFDFFGSAQDTGAAWVLQTVSHLELLAVLVGALIIQFYRRNTRRARVLFVGGLLVFMWINELPWRVAFAVQEWVSPATAVGEPVSIAFDPAAQTAAVAGPLFTEESEKKSAAGGVDLPLHISGLAAGMVLHTDHVNVRIHGADGRSLYHGAAQLFDVRGPDALVRLHIEVPRSVDLQAAQAEIDLALTLMSVRSEPLLAAADGSEKVTSVGRCASRISADGKAVEVGCRQAGAQPPCLSLALQRPDGTGGGAEKFECELSYEPPSLRFGVEPIDHFQLKLPFHGTVAGEQVVLRVYEPVAHFSRKVAIPHIPPPVASPG